MDVPGSFTTPKFKIKLSRRNLVVVLVGVFVLVAVCIGVFVIWPRLHALTPPTPTFSMTVSGTFTDGNSGAPVEGADIYIYEVAPFQSPAITTVTKANGTYTVNGTFDAQGDGSPATIEVMEEAANYPSQTFEGTDVPAATNSYTQNFSERKYPIEATTTDPLTGINAECRTTPASILATYGYSVSQDHLYYHPGDYMGKMVNGVLFCEVATMPNKTTEKLVANPDYFTDYNNQIQAEASQLESLSQRTGFPVPHIYLTGPITWITVPGSKLLSGAYTQPETQEIDDDLASDDLAGITHEFGHWVDWESGPNYPLNEANDYPECPISNASGGQVHCNSTDNPGAIEAGEIATNTVPGNTWGNKGFVQGYAANNQSEMFAEFFSALETPDTPGGDTFSMQTQLATGIEYAMVGNYTSQFGFDPSSTLHLPANTASQNAAMYFYDLVANGAKLHTTFPNAEIFPGALADNWTYRQISHGEYMTNAVVDVDTGDTNGSSQVTIHGVTVNSLTEANVLSIFPKGAPGLIGSAFLPRVLPFTSDAEIAGVQQEVDLVLGANLVIGEKGSATTPIGTGPNTPAVAVSSSGNAIVEAGDEVQEAETVGLTQNDEVSELAGLPTGINASSLVASPNGGMAYAASGRNILAVTTANNAVATFVGNVTPANDNISSLSISPDGTKIYALCDTSATAGSLYTINVETKSVSSMSISAPDLQFGRVAVSTDGTYVYVIDPYSNSLYVITAANTIHATVSLNYPSAITVSPDGKEIYVLEGGVGSPDATVSGAIDMTLATVDTSTYKVTATSSMPGLWTDANNNSFLNFMDSAISADGSHIYLTHYNYANLSKVYAINLASDKITGGGIFADLGSGNLSFGVATSPDGDYVYVTQVDPSATSSALNEAFVSVYGTEYVYSGTQPTSGGNGTSDNSDLDISFSPSSTLNGASTFSWNLVDTKDYNSVFIKSDNVVLSPKVTPPWPLLPLIGGPSGSVGASLTGSSSSGSITVSACDVESSPSIGYVDTTNCQDSTGTLDPSRMHTITLMLVSLPPAPPAVPTLNSFTATSSTVTKGSTDVLNWTSSNADYVLINGAQEATSASLTTQAINSNTTFTAQACSIIGSCSPSETVTITLATSTPAPPTTSPTIASFTASSTTVSASGENVELYWTTSNFVTGDYVTINNVKVGGSSDIQEIIKTTTFTIQACTAAGVCGSSRSLAITYAPPGVPTITSLYGSNQSATTTEPPGVYNNVFLWSGGSFTLNWTSANASSVRIFLNSDLDHYMTEKTNGSIASLQYINPATDYAEACSATSCGSPISLNVLIIPSLVFSVNPSQITAGSKSTLSWSSYLDSAGAPGVYTNFTATTNGKTTTSTGSAASGTATYAYSSTTAYSVQACYIDPQNNYEPICSMVKTATITVK